MSAANDKQYRQERGRLDLRSTFISLIPSDL
ncbi:hypothetical protein HDF16_005978 [Granulicella aggregans]|uniref:Uncharacterized protein n=1 Tax=Granulicella aggregans TaxID=474949 RepID=A0A7W7ZK38_9BACT|nr:hypothetical protein [Granulicella aggregans]